VACPVRSTSFESSAIHEDAVRLWDRCSYCLYCFLRWLKSTKCPTPRFFRLSALGWADSTRRNLSSLWMPSKPKWSETQRILCYLERKRWFLITPLQQGLFQGSFLAVLWSEEIHAISMLIETALPVLAVWTSQVCQRRRESIYSQKLQKPGAYSPSSLDLHTDLVWGYLITILNMIYMVH